METSTAVYVKDGVAHKDVLQKINRYYISNKGCKIVKINKSDKREIQLESGQWVQTVMNKIENKKWSDYDINEKYYLNAIEKEINNIIGIKNNQLLLFNNKFYYYICKSPRGAKVVYKDLHFIRAQLPMAIKNQ